MIVLFLCTGNYYRSRFAELLFNHLAGRRGLDVSAGSLGLAVERGTGNVGALSVHTAERLAALGVPRTEAWERMPRQAGPEDFTAFDRIIALDEEEHRPLMKERFPGFEKAIDYWRIHDLDQSRPEEALPQIEAGVRALIQVLTAN